MTLIQGRTCLCGLSISYYLQLMLMNNNKNKNNNVIKRWLMITYKYHCVW